MGQRRRGSSPVTAEVITYFWWEIDLADSSFSFSLRNAPFGAWSRGA